MQGWRNWGKRLGCLGRQAGFGWVAEAREASCIRKAYGGDPGTKAEGRVQNAEWLGKAAQSHAGAGAAHRAQAFASAVLTAFNSVAGKVPSRLSNRTDGNPLSPWRGVICCPGDPELPVPLGATAARQPTLLLRGGE